jgi:hypothetical protein
VIAHGTESGGSGPSSKWDATCDCDGNLPATVSYTFVDSVACAFCDGEDNLQYLAWLDLCCWLDRIEWRVRRQIARHGNDDVGTEQVTLVITPRIRGPPVCLTAAPFEERYSQRRGSM